MKIGLMSFLALTVLGGSCGLSDQVEISSVRVLSSDALDAVAEASSEERFTDKAADDHSGHGHAPGEHGGASDKIPFDFVLPEGWVDLGRVGSRMINLQPGGVQGAECYLSVLAGDGGGVLANANRWRDQIGMPILNEESFAELPVVSMLNMPAVLIQGQGRFTGMGDQDQAEFGLMGLIQLLNVPVPGGDTQTFAVFLKFVGPADLVAAHADKFKEFYGSLAPAGQEPRSQAAAPARAGLAYELPSGWTDRPASGMRVADLLTGNGLECTVIELAGPAGGLASNVNRWRKQLGLDPVDEAGLGALEQVDCLGSKGVLFDETGTYSGMSGGAVSGARMLGCLVIGDQVSYFIKLTGPVDQVAAEQERFMKLLTTLRLDA